MCHIGGNLTTPQTLMPSLMPGPTARGRRGHSAHWSVNSGITTLEPSQCFGSAGQARNASEEAHWRSFCSELTTWG